MPAHELNTLYRCRERLRATDTELRLLFSTILADESGVKPGWYWFRDLDLEKVKDDLVGVALFNGETPARARSFEILRRVQVPIFAGLPDSLVRRSLRAIPPDLYDAVWAYLVDVTKPSELPMLVEWAAGSWLESRIQWLQDWIGTSRDLDRFMIQIPDPELIPEPMRQSIRTTMSHFADGSLQAIKSMSIPDLNEAVTAELRARGTAVSEGERVPDTAGQSLASMFGGLAPSLASDGKETDQQRYDRLHREDSESLRSSLGWYRLDGVPSYQLLVERGEITREVVRQDLSDGFKRIRDESYRQLEKSLGPEVAARQLREFENLNEFVRREHVAAALTAWAKDPKPEDAPVARQHLHDHLTRMAALQIIVSKGTAMDVNDLIDIARTHYGEERKLALQGIRALAAETV